MRSPGGIATFASGALCGAILIGSIANEILRNPADGLTAEFPLILLEATLFGVVVWLGTYIGARMAPTSQRTPRFAKVLAVTYAAFGVVMTIPVMTHAVKLDMRQSGAMPKADIAGPLLAIGTLLLFVIVPIIVTRTLATICVRGFNRGA